jgi:S1-C subfamily serine protease
MISKKSLYTMAKALEGLPILGALDGTPALRAGIRYGDILLEVNGQKTTSMLDYIRARGRRDDGMDLVVFRGGAQLRISLLWGQRPQVDPASLLAEIITLRVGPIDAVDDDGPDRAS